MTRQEIQSEKETISYMILGNIQKNNKFNQLASLLVRQAWLSSEIIEDQVRNNHHKYINESFR
jgi:hypothetical protein